MLNGNDIRNGSNHTELNRKSTRLIMVHIIGLLVLFSTIKTTVDLLVIHGKTPLARVSGIYAQAFWEWLLIIIVILSLSMYAHSLIAKRRRIEGVLALNQRTMSTLMSNLPGMAYSCRNDIERTMLFTSDGSLTLTGYHPVDLIDNRHIAYGKLIHQDDREEVIKQIGHALRIRCPFQMTYRIRTATGEERWVWEKGLGIYDQSGAVEAIEGFVTDITERKRAEDGLMRMRDHYVTILEEFPALIWRSGLDGELNYFNTTWCQFTGRSMDDEVNDAWKQSLHPEDRDNCDAVYNKAFALRLAFETECRLRRRDGEYRWVVNIGRPFYDLDGEFAGYLGACYDITERVTAEQSLHSALQLYQDTLTTIPSSILLLDGNLNILMTNHRYLEEHGFNVPDVIGKSISDVMSQSFLEENDLLAKLKDITAVGGQLELLNLRHTSDSHAIKYLNIRIRGISSAGQSAEVLLVIDDITQQFDLEEQIRQAVKLESVGRLAGGVAHDFNNLLTGITGYAQLLLRRLSSEDPMCKDLIQIRELADRAAELVRHLLAFSRRQSLEPVVLDVNELVSNTVKLLNRLIGEDIELKFQPAAGNVRVKADPAQIEQVLMNLAVNSRDAMPNGGMLTITVGNVVLDSEYAFGHLGVNPGEYVLISVTDTGCGIDEETLKHIFEPFFTTKEVGKGTGLGLSSVYGIINQHSGHVRVSSKPGEGTAFNIYLPAINALYAEDSDKNKESVLLREQAIPIAGETVFLVEDDISVMTLVERVLTERGYKVVSASRPDEALEIYKEKAGEIDLLLTDVILPGFNGKELYDRLVEINPKLKVIFMSGYTANTLLQTGGLGSDIPFLQKPFMPDDITNKIRSVLDA
ncbi:MAG: PAS domain S-box protein [bacterium]|nr:PAS domain S-box protein [bacterium]